MIDASTNQTVEQHSIVYCCYLSMTGKGAPTISFVELLSNKDSIRGGGYVPCNKEVIENITVE